jgi:hypothetical protein
MPSASASACAFALLLIFLKKEDGQHTMSKRYIKKFYSGKIT